ncbi:lipopolysaccharide transport periplasmic protein LptA [Hippea alviniae]|uniref:lipopolysaccharide transport periplasmic protein LptA n=1 Tax=Hippea alviniae TaxID=1279027 RepID=UPI0003B39A01|nr:lipopolysaccharide transport periplasmic protein LptA [Hippea alviniae]
MQIFKKMATVSILLLALSFSAFGVNPKQYLGKKHIPLHITADKLTAFDKKGLYIFEGNVIARRGDTTLKSDKMEVYKNLKTGDISKVICTGHVVITKENKKATANKAIYNATNSEVTLIGNAVVISGKNTIKAGRIVYYLNKDYVVSQESNKNKRVEVTIYPKEKENK